MLITVYRWKYFTIPSCQSITEGFKFNEFSVQIKLELIVVPNLPLEQIKSGLTRHVTS